jgi:hypothetical protein
MLQNPESHKFEYWDFFDMNDERLNEETMENHSFKVIKKLK